MNNVYKIPRFAPGVLLIAAVFSSLILDDAFSQNAPTAERLTPSPKASSSMSEVHFDLGWQQSSKTFSVLLTNDSNKPLQIEGIQTTAGLYVVSFPQLVAANSSADIQLTYAATMGGGDVDLVRLLTNRGDKQILVTHPRQQVVQLSARTLQWAVGEAPAPKSVTFTVTGNVSVPQGVETPGKLDSASLNKLADGTYQITVNPGSTASPRQFPVVVDFSPKLPGTVVLVTCFVGNPGQ